MITLKKEQFNRYRVIQEIIDGQLTAKDAAEALNLSTRQLQRLKKEIKANGVEAEAIVHGNANRRPANAHSEDTTRKIIELEKDKKFEKCNYAHFREILDAHFGIII